MPETVDTSEYDLSDAGEHICSRRHNSVQGLMLNGRPYASLNLPFKACSPQIRNMAVDDFFHQLIQKTEYPKYYTFLNGNIFWLSTHL